MFAAPVTRADCDRLVSIMPMLLRRRMSRETRITVKFVCGDREMSSSLVCMFTKPTL